MKDINTMRFCGDVCTRSFDIVFAISALAILAIPLLLTAAAVKLTSRGPVLYTQMRTGLHGELFKIYKFRSIKLDSCRDDIQINRSEDSKTLVGKFIRKYSIDEMPQFFNVLIGDMSVVGPRPHPIPLDAKFSEAVGIEKRYAVKPGITGLAQINKCRGETRTMDEFQRRVKYDVEYIENKSIAADVTIIALTLSNVFTSNTGS